MPPERRSIRAGVPALLFLASVLSQVAWSDPTPPGDAPPPAVVSCPAYGDPPSDMPPDLPAGETSNAGTIPGAFAVSSTGAATYTMPLALPPGRAGMEPHLAVVYDSNGGDGPLGMGFALSGLSAITRCASTVAQDGKIRDVRYDAGDQVCLDGRRLVRLREDATTIEYRTFPDSFARIVAVKGTGGPQSFEVETREGLTVSYGTTPSSAVMATGGVRRAWLAAVARDRRGNFITYDYWQSAADDGHTTEHGIDTLRYTGFRGRPLLLPSRVVRFGYEDKEAVDRRTSFTHGMAVTASRRLRTITAEVGAAVTRTYHFRYDLGPTTGRTRLTAVRECAGDWVCKPSTRFTYRSRPVGFLRRDTQIPAPFSDRASPMLLDVTGDGLDDLVVPDLVEAGDPGGEGFLQTETSAQLIPTFWNTSRNIGSDDPGVFVPVTGTKLSESGYAVGLPATNAQIQPELGTALDYDQDGRSDLFLHDVYRSFPTWLVYLATPGGHFQLHDTGIAVPPGLRATGPGSGYDPKLQTLDGTVRSRERDGSVHLADLDGDGVPDLIQCNNANYTTTGSTEFEWEWHRWSPEVPGWVVEGTPIAPLERTPCDVQILTVDVDADGKVDLLTPENLSPDGVHYLPGSTFDAYHLDEDGAWASDETNLPVEGRVLFLDVNGDGLPDALEGTDPARLSVYFNTGKGFAKAVPGLPSPVLGGAARFLHLAQALDYDGDGRRDLLLPIDEDTLSIPAWRVLRSTGNVAGPTFEILDPQIPFLALLSNDGITLADPHGPRIGDTNGDGAPDVVLPLSGKMTVFENQAADQDVLASVADGLNEHDPGDPAFLPNVALRYEHLVDRAITDGSSVSEPYTYVKHHASGGPCTYPLHCVAGPMRVVSRYETNTGISTTRGFTLKYRDGRYHRLGRGFLGFGSRVIADEATGGVTQELYDNATRFDLGAVTDIFPYAGMVVHERRWNPPLVAGDPFEMSFADVTPSRAATWGGSSYFSLPRARRTRRVQGVQPPGTSAAAYALDVEKHGGGVMLSDITSTVTAYDTFGNVLGETTTAGGMAEETTVTRTFENDLVAWKIGLLTSTETCSAAGGPAQCRGASYEYDGAGQVNRTAQRGEPGNAEASLTVWLARDVFGNVTRTTARDGLGEQRASCTTYEPEGIYPFAQSSDPDPDHVTYLRFHAGHGLPLAVREPNTLTTRWAYDGFGRTAEERGPDGTATHRSVRRVTLGGRYRTEVRTTTDGGADDTLRLDSLGRPVESLWHGPQAPVVTCVFGNCTTTLGPPARLMSRVDYDELGRLFRRTLPAREGTPSPSLLRDEYEHDALGRVTLHVSPWGARTETVYDGRSVVVFPPTGHPTMAEHDGLGRVIRVSDAAGGVTEHAYGPFGALETVTAPDQTRTVSLHDAWGRVIRTQDADRGVSESHFNGFGDLISTTDAAHRTARFFRDALGRTVVREDWEGGALAATTRWTWDEARMGTGMKAVGALASVESPDATKEYAYDDKGRLARSTLSVGGESWEVGLGYDAYSRLSTIAYPRRPLEDAPFTVAHDLDAHGHLMAVRDAHAAPAVAPFWRLSTIDAAGRTRTEVFGNGVSTTWGFDDAKERVTSIRTALGATSIQDLSYTYDIERDLIERRDELQRHLKAERFAYDALHRLTCTTFGSLEPLSRECAQTFRYDAAGNLTHKSDVGLDDFEYGDPRHPHAVTRAGGDAYGYDAVGNQVARPGLTTVAYTAFDLPKSISWPHGHTDFGYDGDQRRVLKATAGGDVTVYAGDLYERVLRADGTAEHRYHVHAGGRLAAIVTRGKGSASHTRYVHPDHLGSVDTLTDEAGAVVEKKSFDAFGARRLPEWGQVGPVSASETTQGFTGHEADEELGLVNMRGRMYDPRLGRFLSTDPVVGNVLDGQRWNPYSYVRNNPLRFVDPTGYWDMSAPVQYAMEILARYGGAAVASVPAPQPPGAASEPASSVPAPSVAAPSAPPAAAAEGTPAGPPTPPAVGPGGEPAPDVSQSMAAGAARPPYDLGVLGTTTMAPPPPEPPVTIGGIGGKVAAFLGGLGCGILPGCATSRQFSVEVGLANPAEPEKRVPWALGEVLGGGALAVVGGAGDAAGLLLAATGFGAPGGAAVMVTSAAIATAGMANIGAGSRALSQALTATSGSGNGTPAPKAGSAGGAGSGKRFSEATKDKAEAAANGKCVFCGRETTRTPGPLQRNTDHAIPKSRGGNNSAENAQNTCRDCNLSKGARTSEEYIHGD